MDSNTFLFEPIVPEMGHIWVGQAQVASTYVQVVAHQVWPVSTKNIVPNQYICTHSFGNIVIAGKPLRRPLPPLFLEVIKK